MSLLLNKAAIVNDRLLSLDNILQIRHQLAAYLTHFVTHKRLSARAELEQVNVIIVESLSLNYLI